MLIPPGVQWGGVIDLLWERGDGRAVVVDLKSPGRVEDGWVVSGGKNILVPWWQAWTYWFQLAGYVEGVRTTGKYSEVEAGILYVTREKTPGIGFIAIPDSTYIWRTLVEQSLPIIRAIVAGEVEAPRCGSCDYCKSTARIELPGEWPQSHHGELVIPDLYQ